MNKIKIQHGTPHSGKSLCIGCKHSKRVEGQNMEERIVCNAGVFGDSGRVPFKVAECSVFHPTNMPWLHEMEDMAWQVQARRRGPVGFEKNTDSDEQMEVTIQPPKRYNSGGMPTGGE